MSVRDQIELNSGSLTQSERKLASALLSDYPYAGLVPIQELAGRSEVSAPSISRFVVKIGLSGYQEMQRLLIAELAEGNRSPVEIHRTGRKIEGGFLEEFMSRAATGMNSAGAAITEAQFERIVALLSERKRNVFAIGGRASNSIAMHLSFHLRQARRGVFHLPSDPDIWPEYLLRMKAGDIFFLVDFRRYQPKLARLAELASGNRRARVPDGSLPAPAEGAHTPGRAVALPARASPGRDCRRAAGPPTASIGRGHDNPRTCRHRRAAAPGLG